MLPYRLLLLIGLAFSSIFYSTRSTLELTTPIGLTKYVPDSVTYEFLHAILQQEFENYPGFFRNNVLERNYEGTKLTKQDSLQLTCMDSLFTPADVRFIYQQVAQSESFRVNPILLKQYHVIPWDSIYAIKRRGGSFLKKFEKSYGKAGFCFVGMPLFTQNKQIAIIRRGMLVCNFCGEDELLIYQKQNQIWKKIYTLQSSPEF